MRWQMQGFCRKYYPAGVEIFGNLPRKPREEPSLLVLFRGAAGTAGEAGNPKGLTLQLADGPEGDVSIDYLCGVIQNPE